MSDLRALATWLYREKAEQRWSDVAEKAADEIERLTAENGHLQSIIDTQLKAEVEMQKVIDRQREALKKYGFHHVECKIFREPFPTPCSCGFTQALNDETGGE